MYTAGSIYNNRIVNLPRAWLTWTDGQKGECRAAGAEAGGGRRLASGGGRGRRRRRTSQNRDVTPGAWLTGADGRANGYKQSRRTAA